MRQTQQYQVVRSYALACSATALKVLPTRRMAATCWFQKHSRHAWNSSGLRLLCDGYGELSSEKATVLGTEGDLSLIDFSRYGIAERPGLSIALSDQFAFDARSDLSPAFEHSPLSLPNGYGSIGLPQPAKANPLEAARERLRKAAAATVQWRIAAARVSLVFRLQLLPGLWLPLAGKALGFGYLIGCH